MTAWSYQGDARAAGDSGLTASVLASATVHAAGIVLVLMVAPRFKHTSMPLISYSVELVAPDPVGGTHAGRSGHPGRNPPAVAVRPSRHVAPRPAPPRVAKRPAVKKPATEKAKRKKKSRPARGRAAAAGKHAPSVAAKPRERAKSVAAAGAAEVREPSKRDRAIAAAVRRRLRALEQTERSSRPTADGPGSRAALSAGPARGTGGVVKGVEYLVYYNHMISRIKANWAWAGSGQGLEAVVAFRVAAGGEVANLHVLRSSGDRSYDASVERAILSAGSFGPPPARYREEFAAGVELVFRPEDLRL